MATQPQHTLISVLKLCTFYIVPLALIILSFSGLVRWIPVVGNQYIIMSVVVLLTLLDALSTGLWRQYELFGNWKESIRLNIFVMGVLMVIYTFIYSADIYPKGDLSELNRGIPSIEFVFFYIFYGVPIQQLFVWGDFRTRVKSLHLPKYVTYILVALFYAATHLLYPEPGLILAGTFTIGLVWTAIQDKTHSVVGSVLSHILFGLVAFMLNLA